MATSIFWMEQKQGEDYYKNKNYVGNLCLYIFYLSI